MNVPLERMEPAAAIECLKAFQPKVVYPYHYDQDWVARVKKGAPRPEPTTRGFEEVRDGAEARGHRRAVRQLVSAMNRMR